MFYISSGPSWFHFHARHVTTMQKSWWAGCWFNLQIVGSNVLVLYQWVWLSPTHTATLGMYSCSGSSWFSNCLYVILHNYSWLLFFFGHDIPSRNCFWLYTILCASLCRLPHFAHPLMLANWASNGFFPGNIICYELATGFV